MYVWQAAPVTSTSVEADLMHASAPTFDAYLAWALATGCEDLDDSLSEADHWLHLIVEVREPKTAKDFAEGMQPHKDWIRIPSVYRHPSTGLESSRYCTAFVKPRFASELRGALAPFVQRFEACLSVRSVHDTGRRPLPVPHAGTASSVPPLTEATPGPIVMAVIDDGIAYGHERFLDEKGQTRVQYFWDQEGGGDVSGLGYGRERDNNAIDRARSAATFNAKLDEDAFYSREGQRLQMRRATHGTHVMDLACGWSPPGRPQYDPDSGPPHPIICVQRHRRRTADTTGRTVPVLLLDGMRYILDRADAYSRKMNSGPCPVFATAAYSTFAGPHDGSTILEAALDELVRLRSLPHAPFAIVMPAGNNLLARSHALVELAPQKDAEFTWRVQPENAMPVFLEIWPRSKTGAEPVFEVQITSPDGAPSPWIRQGNIHRLMKGSDAVASVVHLRRCTTGATPMALVAIAPTLAFRRGRQVALGGAWKVAIRNASSEKENNKLEIHAWIQRGDSLPGEQRRGMQSRFDDPKYLAVDPVSGREVESDAGNLAGAYVRRSSTLNPMATVRGWSQDEQGVLMAAGYRRSDGATATYSSAAPSLGGGLHPVAALPTEESPALHGVLAAGTRARSVVAQGGTSVAAPQLARRLAEAWRSGHVRPSAFSAFSAAQRDESQSSHPVPLPAQERVGGGRMITRQIGMNRRGSK